LKVDHQLTVVLACALIDDSHGCCIVFICFAYSKWYAKIMAEKSVPNIFILLDLDPNQPWNQVEFEKRLETKRREWAKDKNLPTDRGQRAMLNLGMLREIINIAGNETLRQEQASEARQKQQKEKTEKLKELDARLEILQVKGFLLQDEYLDLVSRTKDLLSESDLQKLITVKIRKDEPVARKGPESLDSTTTKQIGRLLKGLNKSDLYEFLELLPYTETSILLKKSQEKYKDVTQKPKTPEVTLQDQLCGHCLKIFKSQSERDKYDETLRLTVYDEIKDKIDIAAQSSNEIAASQLEVVLRFAIAKNLNLDETLEIIKEHVSAKKYKSLIIPAKMLEIVEQLQRCGYCNHLNDPSKKFCTECSKPLLEPCPKCNTQVKSVEKACGACGYPTGNRAYIEILVHDADRALNERNYSAALEYIDQSKSAWPVESKDALAERIRDLADKVNSEIQTQKKLLSQMETNIQERRFYGARRLLPDLDRALPDSDPLIIEYRRKIEERLKQVDSLLINARSLKKAKPDDLIQAYSEILSLCRDCQEARDVLAKTPPQPPTNLRAQVSGKLVHLTWLASSSQGVSYYIVRKERSRPISPQDGNRLATTEGTAFDDTTGEAGVPYFYAAFANREEVFSKEGAILDQPVVLIQDVDKLTAQIADHQVHLKWQAPPNVEKILVRRGDKAFSNSLQDGVAIQTLDLHQAVDNQVENEHRYFYTVYCQFKDLVGKPIVSSGARIEAVPQQPPEPIRELSIIANGPPEARKLQITLPQVSKGDVVVIKTNRSTGLLQGMEIPASDLSRYGQVLKTKSGYLSDELNQLGVYYYLPVVIFMEMAYIGLEHKYASVDDISELTAQNLGHALRLQWRWPMNCNEVMVSYSHKGWPIPHTTTTTTITLTRAQYDLKGFYDIPNPIPADYYIVVFAVIGQGEQKIIASGDHPGACCLVSLQSRIILEYEIKKTLLKKFSVELRVQGQGTLPALILIRKHLTLPMNKQDGDGILKMAPVEIGKNQWSVPIPGDKSQRHSYVKLFLEDDQLYDIVTIRQPAREKLRLY
jgi:hypothetical protein